MFRDKKDRLQLDSLILLFSEIFHNKVDLDANVTRLLLFLSTFTLRISHIKLILRNFYLPK